MEMSIRSISDIVESGVVEFESVDSDSAFISGLSGLKQSMKTVKKLYKLLEANGYKEAGCKGDHYEISGEWRNAENQWAFQIAIRYGDTVLIQEVQ
jgi:hypothetical protein